MHKFSLAPQYIRMYLKCPLYELQILNVMLRRSERATYKTSTLWMNMLASGRSGKNDVYNCQNFEYHKGGTKGDIANVKNVNQIQVHFVAISRSEMIIRIWNINVCRTKKIQVVSIHFVAKLGGNSEVGEA